MFKGACVPGRNSADSSFGVLGLGFWSDHDYLDG